MIRKTSLAFLSLFIFLAVHFAQAEPPDFKVEFLKLCDADAKVVEKQTDLPIPAPMPIRGFFQDSYAVRALAVAYDITGKPEYLNTCKLWSDRMIRDQKGMIPKGAYYMNIDRAPGQNKGEWNVADCGSIAMGILATAVRCDDPAEKAKYLDSVKAFFRLVADNWVRPSGGIANGHWSQSNDEFWCATSLFGSLAFYLYNETGDPECLRIGLGTIDWLNRQDLLTVANDFYEEKYIQPTVIVYCLEAYSAGLPFIEKGSGRHKAAVAQLEKSHEWILRNMNLPRGKYLSHWGSKRSGLPLHLYIYASQVPGNEKLLAAADRELTHVCEIIENAPAESKLFSDQLTVFALMSLAEKVAPGKIYRSSNSKPDRK